MQPLGLLALIVLALRQDGPVTVAGLGTLQFPVSTGSSEARQAFLRGTLLLHLFHYDDARTAYRRAQ
ncbi:MAG TPA: hypothetical protein VHE78_19935, partial [Gemmatimonadaceae bacterium]|nr:hypothetical protein [Gemmatimonadaceae bacterium]